jgi:hypothetical protein
MGTGCWIVSGKIVRSRGMLARAAQAWLVSSRAILLGSMAISSAALATDRTWDGFSSNQFTLGSNWTLSVAPGSNDVAIFKNHPTVSRSLVILNTNYSIAGMSVSSTPSTGPWEFQRQGNALLTVGTLEIGSTATFNGFAASCGSMQVDNSGSLSLTGNASLASGPLTVQNIGVMNVGASTVSGTSLGVGSNGIVNVNSGGSISIAGVFTTFNAGSRININSGGAMAYTGQGFLHAGTVTVNGTGTLNIGSHLTTDGPGFIQFNRGFALPAGKTINISQTGDLASTDFVDIASGGTGTLIVDGSGSSANIGTDPAAIYSYWGFGGAATITFSTAATGDYNRGLVIGNGAGANSQVNIDSVASVNVDTFLGTGGFGGIANITINNATLTSTGTTTFGSGTTIELETAGVLGFSNDATFSVGSTLNWTGGTLSLAAGKTLNIPGGAINNTAIGLGLPNAATVRITNSSGTTSGGTGGQFNNSSYFDIANGVGTFTGTMLLDGAGSQVTTGGTIPSDWGRSANNVATVTISNGGLGIYNGLRISTNGGTTRLTLSNGGQLGVATLETGSSTVGSNASITINGGGLNVTNYATFSGGTQVAYNSGSFVVLGTLDMSSNAKVLLSAGGDKVLRIGLPSNTGTLIMSGTSKIDLADNFLISHYVSVSPLSTIAGYVKTGSSSSWSGNALTSSTARTVALDAANPHKTGLGYIETSVSGFPIVEVAYTYLGDANLDGNVNALDFNALASNFGGAGKFWFSGDFDYNGTVNMLDFNTLASNFNQVLSFPAPALGAVVPEPRVVLISALLMAGHRRRRKGFGVVSDNNRKVGDCDESTILCFSNRLCVRGTSGPCLCA